MTLGAAAAADLDRIDAPQRRPDPARVICRDGPARLHALVDEPGSLAVMGTLGQEWAARRARDAGKRRRDGGRESMSVHSAEGTAPSLSLLGVEMRVRVPADASGGGLSLFEEATPPGGGPPLHLHRDEDEFFRVMEGRFRFRAGEATIDAGPGGVLFVPRGTPHCFFNAGETTGRLFMGLTPGRGAGFFQVLAESGLTPAENMAGIAALAADYGIEFLGPNPFGDG